MTCTTCETELLDNARFCPACGAGIRPRRAPAIPAGLARRILADLIDIVLLAPVFQLAKECSYLFWMRSELAYIAAPSAHATDRSFAWVIALLLTIMYVTAAPYCIVLECSPLRATLGKRIMGLQVVTHDGRRIGWMRAILRHAARLVSSSVYLLGYFMAAFTPRKRSLHDYLSGTEVIRRTRNEDVGELVAGVEMDECLVSQCPVCDRSLEPDVRYCPSCGRAVPLRRTQLACAGWWRRAIAATLDLGLIFYITVQGYSRVVVILGLDLRPMIQTLEAGMQQRLSTVDYESVAAWSLLVGGSVLVSMYWFWGFYNIIGEASPLQGTLGKRLLGLRVTGLDGERIGVGRAAGRHLARLFSIAPWMSGYFMAMVDPRKQTLHDVLAGTLVLRRSTPDLAADLPIEDRPVVPEL